MIRGRARTPGMKALHLDRNERVRDQDRRGQEPTLGVLLLAPPRLSETFITHEIEALLRRRLPIRVYALQAGGKAGEEISAPPARRAGRALALFAAHLALCGREPCGYLRLLWRKVIRRTWLRLAAARARRVPVSFSHVQEFVLAGWLATEARRAGLTHLHAHYASLPAAVAALVHELIGLPFSFTAHAKDVYTASPERLRKKIQASTFVTTCSGGVRDYLVQTASARAESIHLVHHGISPEVLGLNGGSSLNLSPNGSPNGNGSPPLILSAGRLVEKKGFEDLVRALALLRERDVPFRAEIVGEGRLLPVLREMAGAKGLDELVAFPGAMPHAVLARHYPSASCFVLPSRQLTNGNRDGIPNVLLEAMAAGVPVVASRAGGIPEIVTHGVTGILVPERNAVALAGAIGAVLASPAEAAERAARAKSRVRAGFDLERSVDRLVALWRDAGALPGARRRPLRVGYVLKRYPRLSETFVLNEILEQERQGTVVHIVSLKKPDEGRFHADLARVKAGVSYLPGYILPSLGVIARSNWNWFRRRPRAYLGALGLALQGGDRHRLSAFLKAAVLADLAVAKRCDVLHAHFATGATFSAMLASRLSGIPFGFTAHARDLFGEHISPAALRRKVARASYVVVVSRATRQHLQELVGEELAAKAVCIYNGVDRRLLSQRRGQHSRGAPLLLGVGRLVEKKGFAHLLAAADLLRARGLEFRLAIAGDGPLRRALEQQAADLSLPVRFLGPLPHDQVKRAMAGAYAVVLPAIVAADGDRDVLPTVLLEAQALAKPVVATRLTGIPEIVDDGATGLLVPADDSAELPAALAGALQQLLRDPEFSHRLGTAGRERMAARFALASSVTALAACMRGEGAPLVGMEAT